jgi:serine/threonine-protein phosphatase 2B catalytic subunit
VVLLRGNHECETLSSFYGFRQECRVKYGLSVYYHFVACFQTLPLAALLMPAKGTACPILCVHGGLSPDIVNLEDIDAIDRRREVPTQGPLCDLLWSDPNEKGTQKTQEIVQSASENSPGKRSCRRKCRQG